MSFPHTHADTHYYLILRLLHSVFYTTTYTIFKKSTCTVLARVGDGDDKPHHRFSLHSPLYPPLHRAFTDSDKSLRRRRPTTLLFSLRFLHPLLNLS